MDKQEITCACGCKRKKMVKTADVARGWGKYYSKSCKAKAQTKATKGKRTYGKMSQRQRFDHLLNAYHSGVISPEYFYHTAESEYSEFSSEWDGAEAYAYLDVHPFSSEGLGQD